MARISDPATLIPLARTGERRALARLITLVENDGPVSDEILAEVFPAGGQAWTTGLTGAPGAGKSTLTDRLIQEVRSEGSEIAVVAVDPSSPFSGGAVLGDRVRMQDHIDDHGVYIRSMASRGHLGGISAATPKVVATLDGLGFPEVFVETVGVGQAEVEIAGNADTTVVVVNPGWGDSVQAAKAGLLEIGDIFVVNKADRPGVHETVRDLTQMLELGA
ncbi:MAG: methylmalonyl Co-A mutase-associated GTPase MeaB, partial [Acidimicrobiia bacterium]|nr:methylmalonyl Co-A mutase-associated GTPase MeaB [Acidimicrobiia bacterium]